MKWFFMSGYICSLQYFYIPAVNISADAINFDFAVSECNLSKDIRQTKRESYVFINGLKSKLFVFIINPQYYPFWTYRTSKLPWEAR